MTNLHKPSWESHQIGSGLGSKILKTVKDVAGVVPSVVNAGTTVHKAFKGKGAKRGAGRRKTLNGGWGVNLGPIGFHV